MSWSDIVKKNIPESHIQTPAPKVTKESPNVKTLDIIDIGANLTNKVFKNDIETILKESLKNNVTHIIITGTSIKKSIEAIQICKRFENRTDVPKLTCTVGVHPHDSYTIKDLNKAKDEMIRLIRENKNFVVAVGECGLDYNRMFSTIEQQTSVFDMQLEIAQELNMPLFLHEREAHTDFVKVIKNRNFTFNGVVHCFTGTRDEMKTYLDDMGFYIGLTGFICNARSQSLRNILSEIPLEKLLIETDAPYMTPQNIYPRPKHNQPMYLTHVLQEISNITGIDPKLVAEHTTKNSVRLFDL